LYGKIDEMHAYIVSLEVELKAHIRTSCSTCELNAVKILELAHYVDRLQHENNELRKMMGWLSGHEPQLMMMIEAYKCYDGQALGPDKIGKCSGGGEKIGDIQDPPNTFHKNAYAPKSNPLRNKLDTTPDPPIFPHPTNDFQKPVKFVSSKEIVIGEKKGEKPSEEKPSEQPQPKRKPKLIRFHCDYCGRDGHKGEFCFKRNREERMAKEWANKDWYRPSNGVPEPHIQMPRAKASVRTVLALGDRKVAAETAGRAPPVRPVRVTG
jgi:hypothetical protein